MAGEASFGNGEFAPDVSIFDIDSYTPNAPENQTLLELQLIEQFHSAYEQTGLPVYQNYEAMARGLVKLLHTPPDWSRLSAKKIPLVPLNGGSVIGEVPEPTISLMYRIYEMTGCIRARDDY